MGSALPSAILPRAAARDPEGQGDQLWVQPETLLLDGERVIGEPVATPHEPGAAEEKVLAR